MVGVGIVFSTDAGGALRVKGLAPGGPASLTGLIMPGDCLVEIDGRDVYRQSVAKVQDEVVGVINSTVTLGFRRGGEGRVHQVSRPHTSAPSTSA